MSELTQSRLKELLKYDPETGIFTWISGKTIGKSAGTVNTCGYLVITINRKKLKAHRLAWIYVNGELPDSDIDHDNLIKTDNRFCNLRKCTKSQNGFNVKMRIDNTSGFKGVSWHERTAKWQAQIKVRKQQHIGYFDTPELASEAYKAKARELHGEFYREVM